MSKMKQAPYGRVRKENGEIVNVADALEKSHKMENFGKTLADRPAADAVPVGAYFRVVGEDEIWQSNGTEWVEL